MDWTTDHQTGFQYDPEKARADHLFFCGRQHRGNERARVSFSRSSQQQSTYVAPSDDIIIRVSIQTMLWRKPSVRPSCGNGILKLYGMLALSVTGPRSERKQS